MRFKLGDIVTDTMTGFTGQVYGICHYLTGCDQALVLPRVKDDGGYQDGHWFDADRLALGGPGPALAVPPANTAKGGTATETLPT